MAVSYDFGLFSTIYLLKEVQIVIPYTKFVGCVTARESFGLSQPAI